MKQNVSASSDILEPMVQGASGQEFEPSSTPPQNTDASQTIQPSQTTQATQPIVQSKMHQSVPPSTTSQSSDNIQSSHNNPIFIPDNNRTSLLKLIVVSFALSLIIKPIHFVFGITVGLLVFAGTGPIIPLILLFVPNIVVITLLTRFLLALSKIESVVIATIMTVLYTFGFLNIQAGFDYTEVLSGNGNYFGGLLSIFLSSLIVWVSFILVYLAVTSARTNKRKTVLYCGIIFTYIALVFIYNTRTATSSFNDAIEKENTARYEDITFNPYTVEVQIDDYVIDDHVYITQKSNNITDLKVYYVPPAGKKSDFFWIQQYETDIPLASEQCLDETKDQNKYYSDTLALDCIPFYTSTDGHVAYYLKPDQETLKKNAFFAHTVFLVKDSRMIIVRAQRIPENRDVENLMKEIVEKLVQVDRDTFFGVKGLEITTRTPEEQ